MSFPDFAALHLGYGSLPETLWRARRGACHRAALCADPLALLPDLRLLQPRLQSGGAPIHDPQRPRAFGSAGYLAHLGISCSKRRRLPKGSIVNMTFAP